MSLLTLSQLTLPALLEEYRRGSVLFREAYRDVPNESLHRTPQDGSWTLHQIAIHLMDSDIVGGVRMKRVASMAKPLLIGFDETAMSQLPGSENIPIELAIELFEMNRRATLFVLEKLPVEAFERCGIHNESGKLTLRDLLEKFVKHLQHHLEFVESKKHLFAGEA